MPERPVISTLAGQASPLLFDDVREKLRVLQVSPFTPLMWDKCTPFVVDHVRVGSNTPFGWGNDVNFEFQRLASVLLDSALEIKLGPTQVTNGLVPANPPGQAYYVDHLGFAFINTLELHFGQNKVFDHDKYDLYFHYRERHAREIVDLYDDCIYGDKTTAERTQLLLNGTPEGKPLIVPLDYIWDGYTKGSLNLLCLAQRMRWVLRSESLSNLVVRPLDGTTNIAQATLPVVTLLLTVGHVSGAENDVMLLSTNSDSAGITQMIHQSQRQYSQVISTVANNAAPYVPINNFGRALKQIRWALLPFHLQDNTGRNDYFMFAPQPPAPIPPGPGVAPGMAPYTPVVNWRIEANALVIQRTIENLYSKAYLRKNIYPSPHGEEIFFQTYSLLPLAKNCAYGMLDYNNLPNPQLIIQLGTGGTGIDPDDGVSPQRLLVIIHADDYNFWYFNRGNWTRAFN